ISNLGKNTEGYFVGSWFSFPFEEGDVKEKIGFNEKYVEKAVHDIDKFPFDIRGYFSIEEHNEMDEKIEELPD
ncbi:antirestriction protein ArdA, partial [Clostridioides difficile]|uniref:antirestriction protein ArdA n=1 Tax=Clostridioides difficile TaxID=1496 RepID=UPI0018DC0F29